MKKISKKLSLSTQTLRALVDAELAAVAGGTVFVQTNICGSAVTAKCETLNCSLGCVKR